MSLVFVQASTNRLPGTQYPQTNAVELTLGNEVYNDCRRLPHPPLNNQTAFFNELSDLFDPEMRI